MSEEQKLQTAQSKYQDTKGLETRSGRGYTIGYVDEINGPDGEEMDGFRPTRYELKELARHWYHRQLKTDIDCFLMGQSGSTDWREVAYAGRRLERIAAVIGDEAVSEIVDELDAAGKERLGEEWWRIFDTGTFEEQQQVVHEIESSYRQRAPSEPE